MHFDSIAFLIPSRAGLISHFHSIAFF